MPAVIASNCGIPVIDRHRLMLTTSSDPRPTRTRANPNTAATRSRPISVATTLNEPLWSHEEEVATGGNASHSGADCDRHGPSDVGEIGKGEMLAKATNDGDEERRKPGNGAADQDPGPDCTKDPLRAETSN